MKKKCRTGTSNYIEVTLYSKTLEMEHKVEEGRAPEYLKERYDNIFRTELKLKNGKLNANKRTGKLLDKKLETYYNYDVTSGIYTGTITKIFGTNEFYRIDVALKKIEENKTIRQSIKQKLSTLLKLINKEGYTQAKIIWCDTFSAGTFKNHIKKIEALGINCITFDRIINGKLISREVIPNFTLIKNSVPDFKPEDMARLIRKSIRKKFTNIKKG